jgi:hypothetical protein
VHVVKTKIHMALAVILGIILCWPLAVAFPINGGDALWVAQSSRALVGCARADVWTKCPGTYQFGWLQHAPAIFLAWKGMDDNSIVFVLTLINFLAFAWLMMVVIKRFDIKNESTWLLLSALLLGPMYAFSVYSFSEMLTFVLLSLFVLELADGKSMYSMAFLAFIISSSRETAFTIVVALAICVLVVRETRLHIAIKKLLVTGVASCAGLSSIFLFNIWKYGTIINGHYADPIRRVPGTVLKIKNVFAIWISPSGGVLPFWLLGGLLSLSIPVISIWFWRSDIRRAIAGSILLGTLSFQTFLLASWYAPFGWVTWGPRLILPIVGATLITCFVLYESIIQQIIDFIRFKFVLVSILLSGVFLSGVSNLGFILNRSATLAWFTPPLLPYCRKMANVEIDRHYYFLCALDFAPWQLGRTLWDAGFHQVTHGWGLLYFLLEIALLGGTLYGGYGRRSATITDPPATEGIFASNLSTPRNANGNSGKGTPTA